ncbi:MAG: DNA replication/repair protein RecF [Bacilli bacterium]|nr:DNA replication/repair protein RecF [Bacilli bacterium]
MKFKNLELLNFRNYDNLKLNFDDHLNLIYGNNGEGKTNIVEALFLLAYTKSFRTNNDKNLIMFDQDNLRVKASVLNDKFLNNYMITINKEEKKVFINETNYKRLSDYISKINIVLFNRNDLNLIKESPNIRRKNINIDISGFNNTYLKQITIYNKIIKQRNSYLKLLYLNGNMSKDYLDILTNKLIDTGINIYNIRKDYINKINESINKYYNLITNDESSLTIKYTSEFSESKTKLMTKIKQSLSKELILNKTLYGIHHDDFVFYLNGKNIKEFGSEGQQKNAIISYKLAIINYLKNMNINPIFILDDMFSELDNEKINNILKLIDNDLQIFITTTEIDNINNNIKDNAKKIRIHNGTVEVD